ncbi:MAG: hypothetical protein M3142_00720 [Bacteroidota bacterium]|nr:hypothetical protein [Bacteroidota bacterium]
MNQKVYNILWTSGWDSTFRLADLILVKGKIVQPFYVIDENRPSTSIELERMDEIRNQLYSKNKSAKERLLPTIANRVSEIPKNKEIATSMHLLRQQSFLGSQYIFLASFALHHNIQDLELCIHKDDNAHRFLEQYVNKIIDSEGELTYKLKEDAADPNLHTVFDRFLFPVFEWTKTEMDVYAQQHDFKEIMENTWFCHKPLRNKQPCGLCNPCIYTRNEGLGRRVPNPTILDRLEYNYGRAIRKIKTMI